MARQNVDGLTEAGARLLARQGGGADLDDEEPTDPGSEEDDGADDAVESEEEEGAQPSDDEQGEPEPEDDLDDDERAEQEKLNRIIRQRIRGAQRNQQGLVRRAIRGDGEAKDAMSSTDRSWLRLIEEEKERARAEERENLTQAQQNAALEKAYADYDAYLNLAIYEPQRFNQAMRDPGRRQWWNEWERLKAWHKLPNHATASEIKRAREAAQGQVPTQTSSQSTDTVDLRDPESVYLSLQDDKDAGLLTESDWNDLDPDNLDTNLAPEQKSLTLHRLFGEKVAARKRGRSGPAKRAKQNADVAQRARDAGNRVIPIGREDRTPVSSERALDRYLNARQSGKRDPKARAGAVRVLQDMGVNVH